MSARQQDPDIVKDISLLYELSLAIGTSLDLSENCEGFLKTLLARKNLDFAAVWLKTPSPSGGAEPEDYTLAYAMPTSRVDARHLSATHPVVTGLVDTEGCYSVASGDPAFTEISTERNVAQGAYAVFSLGDLGLLKLYSSRKRCPFEARWLNQLRNVLAKFTVSLQGCLSHEQLRREVQERARTNEQLQAATSRLSALIENLQAGILVEDDHRRVALTNQGFCDLFGIPVPPDALIGGDCAEALHQSKDFFLEPEVFVDRIEALLAARQVVVGEEWALVDGRTFTRDYIPIFLDGTYLGHLWQYRDVTEQKASEAEVRHLKGFYEQVLDAMPAQLAVFDPDGRYRYISVSAVSDPEMRAWMIGKTDAEYCGKRGFDPAIGARRMEIIDRVAREKKLLQFEEELQTRSGEPRHIVRFVSPVMDDQGRVVQVLGYGLDITEQKRAELGRAESETRYKQLVEQADDFIYRADRSGCFTYVNAVALRVLGYSEAQVIGESFLAFVPESRRSEVQAFYEKQLGDEIPNTYHELPVRTAEGETIWIGQNVQLVWQDEAVVGVQAVARDITERRLTRTALEESEARKHAIFATALDCIITIDEAGRVLEFNAAAEATFGYRREEIVGQSMVDYIVPPHLRAGHREGMARYQKTRAGQVLGKRIEITGLRADGTEFPVELAITPIRLGDREIFTAYLRDITERKRTIEELEQAWHMAEQSMKAREQFLANMSHEIRTPMNAILGMSHLLRQTQPTEEQQKYLAAITRSSDTLLALINDILDIAKIESGKITFEEVPFRLNDVTQHLVEMVQFDAQEKGLSLAVHLPKDLPDVLIGDSVRLNQVLLNLISNAIKFTEAGSAVVTVRVIARRADRVEVQFEVADTGIGISVEHCEQIFESFTQARSDTTRKYGGTGLGLAIVKELVERQGGTVTVESTVGEGSVFTVTLPFRTGSEAALGLKEHAWLDVDSIDLGEARILLVEDNELNQLVARNMLMQWGAQVDVAENGRVALERLRQAAYDLVLMDIQMPEMDGYEATRCIREELHLSAQELPVLALTASVLIDHRELMEAAGMNDVILKPFDPHDLHRRVALHLGLYGPSADTAPPLDPTAYVDLAFLKANALGNEAFIPQMIDLFLSQTPDFLRRLRQALAEADWPQVKFIAHKMKSSAGMLGISALQAALRTIERHAAEKVHLDELPNRIEDVARLCEGAMEELTRVRQDLEAASRPTSTS